MGHFLPLFIYFSRLYTDDSKYMFNVNFAGGWIRTADRWFRKQPLYQLSHNHCHLMKCFYNVALVGCTIRTDYKRGSNQILQLKTPTNENVRFDFEDISKKNRKLNLLGVANLYLKQVLFSFCR